ncbi:MAG: MFS transporter [Luteimonas sp.]|nr:MFS transporter [Luteimonas sp.]
MLRRWLTRSFNVEDDEVAPVVAGFSMFFLLFAGYFMLRPVRETMGITGGVDNLQWLFTGTFVATLAAMPLFGWIAARVRRRRILHWVFGFFASNLVVFALGFQAWPDNVWLARAFYIWLSVFNLIALSVAWSVLVDVFAVGQAKRLFALMAAGLSAGGLVGPLLGVILVGPIGHSGLLFLSALLLIASAFAARLVQRWRDARPIPDFAAAGREKPLGGSPFAGATDVLRSPYLLGIALFVLLLASVSTFLYFEQARLVEATFPLKTDQTRVFGTIDVIVQTLAILSQLFLTGRLAQRMGVGVLLVAVPLATAAGFLWLALAPTFAVLAVVMVARRAGEYAFVRPGREMLYTVVAPEAKYKAKNFNDTVVYRGADAVSGWVKTGVDLLAQQPAIAALLGALIALAWAATGAGLARAQGRYAQTVTAVDPISDAAVPLAGTSDKG